MPRAALFAFKAVRAILGKQDGSQMSFLHCEKASGYLRDSLNMASSTCNTVDKVWREGNLVLLTCDTV